MTEAPFPGVEGGVGAAEGVVLIEDGDEVAGGGAGGEDAGASDGDLEAGGEALGDTVGGEDAGGKTGAAVGGFVGAGVGGFTGAWAKEVAASSMMTRKSSAKPRKADAISTTVRPNRSKSRSGGRKLEVEFIDQRADGTGLEYERWRNHRRCGVTAHAGGGSWGRDAQLSETCKQLQETGVLRRALLSPGNVLPPKDCQFRPADCVGFCILPKCGVIVFKVERLKCC
ncbi:hypothetical protein GW17_00022171 [Ensete ventricosum]|nr:hypothetical protein GW17_00022171 [Ensete ventricosum]